MWLPEITYKPTQREDRTKSLVEGVGGGGERKKDMRGAPETRGAEGAGAPE